MKLKIKALTNQNVCVDTFTYPPNSRIECELDTRQIPTYAKAFDEWEIIDPVVVEAEVVNVESNVTENRNDEKQVDETTIKPSGKNPTKAKSK